jgi:hypothetical protein
LELGIDGAAFLSAFLCGRGGCCALRGSSDSTRNKIAGNKNVLSDRRDEQQIRYFVDLRSVII